MNVGPLFDPDLMFTGYNTMDGKGWAIHYVEQFVKRDGGLPVAWVESVIEGKFIFTSY